MLLIHAHQLSKRYADDWVLKEIQCEVKSRDRIGLVGRNGSGKTTLLRLLTGHETADQGEVHIQKGLSIGYMVQEFDPYMTLSVEEVLDRAFLELIQLEQRMRRLEAY